MGTNISKGKRNKSTTNSFADLSDPIVADIISLLPIKSIVRCRTVCKAWHQSIAGINFNSIYQKGDDNAYMTLLTVSPIHRFNLFELNIKGKMFETVEPVKPEKLIYKFDRLQRSFTLVGCCNGLICMVHSLRTDLPYYIWNPLLSEYISVPDPRDNRPFHFELREYYGFGYCSIMKEYKILKADSDYNLEVLSICPNTTTTWRSLGKTCCRPSNNRKYCYHYLNGVIHWICRCFDVLDWIYCFDCETEKLSSLRPPRDCSHFHRSQLVTLTVLRNRLCLVHFFDDDIVLWVMENYGVAESWTKISYHNQFYTPPHPLILQEDKDILFFEESSGSFSYYDYDRKVYVNTTTTLQKYWTLLAFSYIPSFVPLLEVFKKNPSKMLIQHSGWLGSLLNTIGLGKPQ